MDQTITQPLTIAVPKGRILKELLPIFDAVGIQPEEAFFDDSSRLLQFATNHPKVQLIRVRSFDVATYVAFGAAHIGICGSDVLQEFDYPDIYAPLDLNIGHCRVSLATVKEKVQGSLSRRSHVRVATKYPGITQRWFAARGIQAECIKLNGAIELAPKLGLASHIVDLVSTGSTLRTNGLEEIEVLAHISSRLIINRTAFKTRADEMHRILSVTRDAVGERHAA